MYIATNAMLVMALLLAPDPMMGRWKADLNDSILPAGFPQLRSQTMVLQLVAGKLQCSTERVSLDGTKTRADFTAAFDGKRYPVKGTPEIATVSLRRYPTFIEADSSLPSPQSIATGCRSPAKMTRSSSFQSIQ
jgi:hypothetical protein